MQHLSMSTPGWVKPGITVVSAAAISTIGFAGTANASTGHPVPAPSTTLYQKALTAFQSASTRGVSPRQAPEGFLPIPGVGDPTNPQFGSGKEVVHVEAMPGTFPEGTTPDLSKVTFTFHQTQIDDSPTPDFATTCENDSSGPTDPLTPCGNLDPLQINQPFTIAFDAAHSELPSGFVAPADVTDTISTSLPPITPLISVSDAAKLSPRAIPPMQTGCSNFTNLWICTNNITIQIPGTWRTIGLNLTNKVTGKPLANTKFALGQGSTTLGSATTDSKGHLQFPGVYQGGNFVVTQKSTPAGYGALGGPLTAKVPAVTTAAQAGKEYDVGVQLAPLPPIAVDDTTTTAQDKATVIKVLSNDTAVSSPLTINSVTQPLHGKAVANPDGTITYTPNTGFSGTDAFSYGVRNALGGTDIATVKVTVVAPHVLGDRLAMTGQASGMEAESGAGALMVGGLLLVAGRRRRESRDAR